MYVVCKREMVLVLVLSSPALCDKVAKRQEEWLQPLVLRMEVYLGEKQGELSKVSKGWVYQSCVGVYSLLI